MTYPLKHGDGVTIIVGWDVKRKKKVVGKKAGFAKKFLSKAKKKIKGKK